MPKQRITREMVVNAAFELARTGGMEQVLVKTIAEKLGCSVQPIYSYCKNMDELRRDIELQAKNFIQDYLSVHIDKDDLFRSTGQAYIQIAKTEPHLFRLFILQQRENIASLKDLYRTETSSEIAPAIAQKYGITLTETQDLHLNMLIYTIGLGTIFSVCTPGISAEEIFSLQESACQAFLNQLLKHRGEKNG